jgi:hypothetical protein
VLPPTDDVRARLAELIAAPKHRAGDREVSSRQTLEAAALIELYKLQIAFPEAMKKEPEYQRYLQHRLMRYFALVPKVSAALWERRSEAKLRFGGGRVSTEAPSKSSFTGRETESRWRSRVPKALR